jgi:hypothetical protein
MLREAAYNTYWSGVRNYVKARRATRAGISAARGGAHRLVNSIADDGQRYILENIIGNDLPAAHKKALKEAVKSTAAQGALIGSGLARPGKRRIGRGLARAGVRRRAGQASRPRTATRRGRTVRLSTGLRL